MGWSEKYKKSIDCDNPKGFSQRAHCQGRKKKMTEEKKDHEYSMARSELKTIKNAVKRLNKKMGKKGEGELQAWVQSKITKAADYIDTAADYVTNEENMHEEGLRDWFGKSKSKGKKGKPGWVDVVDGDACAREEGETATPKCVPSWKRAQMSKKERLSAQARKRRQDPNQPQKSGSAKPTYVKTDYTLEGEMELQEVKDKPGKGSGKKDACYNKVRSRYSVWPSAYASGALVKCRKVGAANWGNKSEEWVAQTAAEYFLNEGLNEDGVAIFIEELGLESFVEFVYDLSEEVITEAKFDRLPPVSKTGKRIADLKGGAKASSIKSKRQIRATLRQKVEDESRSKPGFKSFSQKASATKKAVETAKKQQPKKRGILDRLAGEVLKGMERHKAAMSAARETGKTVSKAAQVGARGAKEFGKGFKSGVETVGKSVKVAKKIISDDYQYSDWREEFKAMEYEFIDIIEAEPLVAEASFEIDPQRHREEVRAKKIRDRTKTGDEGSEIAKKKIKGPKLMGEEQIDELKCWKGYKRKKGAVPGEKGSCVKESGIVIEAKHTPTKSDLESKIGGGNLQKLSKKAAKRIDYDVDGDIDPNDAVEKKTGEYGEQLPTPFGKFRTTSSKNVKVKKEEVSNWREELDEGLKNALAGAGLAAAVAMHGAGSKNDKKPSPSSQSSSIERVSTKNKEQIGMNKWKEAHPKLANKVNNPSKFTPKKLSPINPEWEKAHPELAKKERERREARNEDI